MQTRSVLSDNLTDYTSVCGKYTKTNRTGTLHSVNFPRRWNVTTCNLTVLSSTFPVLLSASFGHLGADNPSASPAPPAPTPPGPPPLLRPSPSPATSTNASFFHSPPLSFTPFGFYGHDRGGGATEEERDGSCKMREYVKRGD